MVDDWVKKEYIKLDGYSSTSLEIQTGIEYANHASKLDSVKVLLKITMENESSRFYICLDRDEYTCYPEEKEILL